MDLNDLRTWLAKIANDDYEADFDMIDHLYAVSNDDRRTILQEAEKLIKQIAGEPEDYYFRRWSENEMEQLGNLVRVRNCALDLMMQPTPNEVRRLEHQNDVLLRRTLDLYSMANDFQSFNEYAKYWEEDYCDLEAELLFTGCEPEEWQRMDEDDYYGSDFGYMLNLQPTLYERDGSYNIIESGTGDMLDDGTSWAEGIYLNRPKFSHICVCHALHSLCTHINYPLPDVLRMNNFSTFVTFQYEKDESFAQGTMTRY